MKKCQHSFGRRGTCAGDDYFSRTLWVPSGMLERLSKKKWFQNHWLSGGYLFGINALYFGTTIFLLYLLMFTDIPYLHLVLMF